MNEITYDTYSSLYKSHLAEGYRVLFTRLVPMSQGLLPQLFLVPGPAQSRCSEH